MHEIMDNSGSDNRSGPSDVKIDLLQQNEL